MLPPLKSTGNQSGIFVVGILSSIHFAKYLSIAWNITLLTLISKLHSTEVANFIGSHTNTLRQYRPHLLEIIWKHLSSCIVKFHWRISYRSKYTAISPHCAVCIWGNIEIWTDVVKFYNKCLCTHYYLIYEKSW